MKKFKIYQVDSTSKEGGYIKFMNLDFVKENGLCTMAGDTCKIDSALYKKVYEGKITTSPDESDEFKLELLYKKFQGTKPAGYTGHSLSVSDVVVLGEKAYYVDSFGFEEIVSEV